jgi:hypothetical protein
MSDESSELRAELQRTEAEIDVLNTRLEGYLARPDLHWPDLDWADVGRRTELYGRRREIRVRLRELSRTETAEALNDARMDPTEHTELLAQLQRAQAEQAENDARIAVYLAQHTNRSLPRPADEPAEQWTASIRRRELIAEIDDLHVRLANETARARARSRADTADALEEARALNARADAAIARSRSAREDAAGPRGRDSRERTGAPRSAALSLSDHSVSRRRDLEAAFAQAQDVWGAREARGEAERSMDDILRSAQTRAARALERQARVADGHGAREDADAALAWVRENQNELQQRSREVLSRNDALDQRAREGAAARAARSRYIPPPPGESLDDALDRRVEEAGARRSGRISVPPDRYDPFARRPSGRRTDPPQRFQLDLADELWNFGTSDRRQSIVAVPRMFAPPALEPRPPFANDPPSAALLASATAQAALESDADATADEPVCTICMCRPRSFVFTPCGHCALCAHCWQACLLKTADPQNEGDRVPICPMCRQRVTGAHLLTPDEIQKVNNLEDIRGPGPFHTFRGVPALEPFRIANARMPCACAAPCACAP